MAINRKALIHNLIESRYERNDISVVPGKFRVRGDTIDIIPGYSDDLIRICLFGDEIEKISVHDHLTMKKIRDADAIKIFPAKHYVVGDNSRLSAIESIKEELYNRGFQICLRNLKGKDYLLAQNMT